MASDNDEPEIQVLSKGLKSASDESSSNPLGKRDAASSEYFEYFFELYVLQEALLLLSEFSVLPAISSVQSECLCQMRILKISYFPI